MTWADPIGDEEWARIHEDFRRCAIRAVVAAQWAAGVVWLDTHTFLDGLSMLRSDDMHRALAIGKANGAWHVGAGLASLPTPEQIVDGAA